MFKQVIYFGFLALIAGCNHQQGRKKIDTPLKREVKEQQTQVFDYENLCKTSLKPNVTSLDKIIYKDSIIYQGARAELVEILDMINHTIPIKVTRGKRGKAFINKYKNQIKIGKKTFFIDSLRSVNNSTTKNEPYQFSIWNGGVYFMDFNKTKYLAFFIKDSNISNSGSLNFSLLLFNVTNVNSPKFILRDYQLSKNTSCFCDFNQDGELDYASHGWLQDSLHVYKIQQKRVTKVKDKFLIIENHFIDSKNSRWY